MDIRYKRILLKLSGEALSSADNPIDFDAVDQVALQIAELVKLSIQVGVVIGGGNIWRGRSSGSIDRNKADHMGMLATAINSIALQDALEKLSVNCSVMSAVQMERFCDEYTAREANRRLADNQVVIFACGTGSPFFSTDTAAALRAAETGAQVLLLAKNVDGVYSADPNGSSGAVRYTHLNYSDVIKNNLKATDLTAITLCKEQNIPVVVFALKGKANIINAVKGRQVGTLID